MKKGIISFLMAMILIGGIGVKAECTVQTFYSRKEWTEHHDFFDVPFTADQHMIINSYQIAAKVNALGTFSFPNTTDSDVQSGKKELIIHGNENIRDFPYFSMIFGKKIRIDEAVIECEGRDNSGHILDKTVWINAELDWDGDQVILKKGEKIMTSSEPRMVIDLQGREVSNLFVLFEDITENGEYRLSYFQIPSYQSYDHVQWVTTPIENTETKQVEVCLDQGKYVPDGTAGVWKKESSGVFTPSLSVLAMQMPEIDSQSAFYDYGRGGHIPAYSDPDVVIGIDSSSRQIRGWTDELEGKYHHYWSYGQKGKEWPYIETAPGSGVRYQADPVYWTQQSGLEDLLWKSTDASWCQHTTGSRKTPCYKYQGHHENSRYNSYDVKLYFYKNLYVPADHKIAGVRYSMKNVQSGEMIFLKEQKEDPFLFSLTESGQWILSAEVQDESGNKAVVDSQVFLIDNQKPQVEYEIEEGPQWKNHPVPVKICGKDQHSQVRRMRWALSADGGNHFSDFSTWINTDELEMTLHDNGILQLKTEIEDHAGNRNVVCSPLICIDQLAPVVDHVQLVDETTGKTVSDSQNEDWLWINSSSKIRVTAQSVRDLPEKIHSGIQQVLAQTGNQKTELQETEQGYSNPVENCQEGKHQMIVTATDRAGNRSQETVLKYYADFTGPRIDWQIDPQNWTNKNVTVSVNSQDKLSGVERMEAEGQVTEKSHMIFEVNENGKYSVTAWDKAGNKTVEVIPVSNIDKVPPTAEFDPFTKETDQKELIVHIQPYDEHSGIDHWRYKITYDEGKSFISTSQWMDHDDLTEVKLSLSGDCRIVVELQDKAGNQAEVISGIYHLDQGDATAALMMVPAVKASQEATGMFRAVCRDCDPSAKQKVTIWQNDTVIYEQECQALPEQTIRFPFMIHEPDTLFTARVEYEQDRDNDNNELKVSASPATEQFIRTEEEEIRFDGVVMYTADQSGKKNYHEQLTLSHPLQKEALFAGQPIRSTVHTHYYNECARIDGWACVAQTLPVSGEGTAVYDQGALPVREHYLDHGRYSVVMKMNQNEFQIPQMWVSQYKGKVNDEKHFDDLEEGEKILDGGHCWYTDPLSEKKTVKYELTGKDFGVNHFSFCFDRQVRIDRTMKESYRMRFVNPQDEQTLHSTLWDPYLDWFKTLKGKTPLKVK